MKKVKSNNKKSKRVFNKEHYNSDNGMLTSIWGPPYGILHTTSFNYPIKPTKADKIHYKSFILNMGYVLPCGSCRDNFNNNLKDLPLRMSDRKIEKHFLYGL